MQVQHACHQHERMHVACLESRKACGRVGQGAYQLYLPVGFLVTSQDQVPADLAFDAKFVNI